jgi:protein O-GlcNAc transferase
MSPDQYDRAFRDAVRHHREGRLAESEAEYRRALALRPAEPDLLQMLGVLLAQRGQLDEGVGLIRRAISVSPDKPAYWANLGSVLANHGNKPEAIDAYRRAVELNPADEGSRLNLANALRETGRIDDALAQYEAAFQLKEPSAEMLNDVGLLMSSRGRTARAITLLRKAAALRPDLIDIWNNLSAALLAAGQAEDAEAAARRAAAVSATGHAVTWFNLANALRLQNRRNEAIDAYSRCVVLRPDFPEARLNFGAMLREAGRLQEALAHLRAAIALRFDGFELRNNMGLVLKDMGESEEAVGWFESALAVRQDPVVESNLIYTSHFLPDVDPPTIRALLDRWNRRYALPLAAEIPRHANDPNPARTLRVGYVAPNLGNHPIGRFLLPLVKNHDPSQVQVFVYCDVATDAVGEQIRSSAHALRPTARMSDQAVARMVRDDGIDVLVDLMMHVGHHRLLVFARKPAPVQITYLAYPGSTGLTAIDYRLTDNYLDPPHDTDGPVVSEKPFRLPHSFWCYPEPAEAPNVGLLPADSNGVVTFGCLNSAAKINPRVAVVWARVLADVPGSVLMLHTYDGPERNRVSDTLTRNGIDSRRILFIGYDQLDDYFARYNEIDIALDPFPYPGGTTTCDALWMGVPVITLCGPTALSRGGVSILSNVGLEEWIAKDADQYVAKAAALARDLPRLRALRSSLRTKMQSSPLMNAPQFARDVEAAMRSMWRQWCSRSAGCFPAARA